MVKLTENLYDKNQTGNRIKELCRKFSGDLDCIYLSKDGEEIPLSELPLQDFFKFVKNIPYKMDKKPVEIVARPYYILKNKSQGADCKKKSILMGAWLERHNIPYRFIASSKRPDKMVHHVFPQGKINGKYINLDATYPEYQPGEKKKVTYAEIL